MYLHEEQAHYNKFLGDVISDFRHCKDDAGVVTVGGTFQCSLNWNSFRKCPWLSWRRTILCDQQNHQINRKEGRKQSEKAGEQ